MHKKPNSKAPPLLSIADQALLQEYLTGLYVQPNNTTHLFGIGFLGLPGSGKSTIADMLSKRLQIPVNRSDQIRRFLNAKGFIGSNPRPDIMASLAEARTQYFYEHHTSIIIDANFTEYARNSLATAERFGARLLLIRLYCPDDVAIERLRTRAISGDMKDSAATHEDYEYIKTKNQTFETVDEVYFEIDTSMPLELHIERLYSQIVDDGFIALSH